MTKISDLTELLGPGVDQAADLLPIVDMSEAGAARNKKIKITQLLGLITDLVGLLDLKGSTDCSANPNYPAASKGDTYRVSVAGKIGGASGKVVEASDVYYALADNAGGTEVGVGTSWDVIQGNATAYLPLAGGTLSGDLVVPAEAYDATAWNGSNEVPTKNDVRDKLEAIIAAAASISDAVYGAGWNGDTTVAPSKNAVYDKIEAVVAGAVTVDNDTTLASDSAANPPSVHAVRGYVATAVTGLLDFKGSTDCSANPNYPAASKGDAYVVSVAGKIGGASGLSVDVGDVFAASADNAGGTQAGVGSSWFVLEHNLVGAALIAAANTFSSKQTLSGGGDITPEATPSTTAIGYLGAPQNLGLDSGNVTLALTDCGKSVDHTDSSARDLTIPANGSVAFPVGTIICGSNEGSGVVTMKITTDTLRWGSSTGQRAIAQHGSWTIRKITSTVWRLTGDGIT